MNPLKNKNIVVIAILFLAVGALVFGKGFLTRSGSESPDENVKTEASNDEGKPRVVVYKSPSCGCCVGYVGYLEKQGYEVEVVEEQNLSNIKNAHNIPYDKQSCHTTVIGDYFIEGHVPIEAIEKLLAEKPEIDGITLPDMPAGSPGMPGMKRGEFEIFSLTDGVVGDFMNL